ncbi:MAG: hypothetical protein EVB05_08855 [Candidatus Thioglobus sp.]|nr:MAG: hypothetical protein EVB05_08855 [Candidatus Thioglobus sp.]|tara:strand:+ start:86 stop:328 length:243 start_codon:yes stop_codon:yes gene_type:complete
MTIELLTIFLGWTTVINILVLIFSALVLLTAREKISKLHARLFGVDQANISQLYFQYLAQYKIAIIVFNIAPYLALRILA